MSMGYDATDVLIEIRKELEQVRTQLAIANRLQALRLLADRDQPTITVRDAGGKARNAWVEVHTLDQLADRALSHQVLELEEE